MAQSDTPTFSLIEEGGVTLELRDRALPYRPLTISGKQRAEFTWYPGNPEATVQMLGPEEGVIQLNGYWKDRFIQGSGAAVVLGDIGESIGDITTVAQLVQYVDNMRRRGLRIKLTWGGLERIGHITSFVQRWNNVHDCEWELDFSVLSQGEVTVPTVTANAPNLSDQMVEALQNAQNTANQLVASAAELADASLTYRISLANAVTDFDTLTNKVANDIYNSVSGVAAYQQAPFDAARRVAASTSGLVTAASQTLSGAIDRALADCIEFSAWGGQDAAPMGIQIAGNSVQRSVHNAVQSVRYSNAVSRFMIEQQMQQDLLASFIAPQNMDLRDVSTRYYGTPDNWQQLMQYNGLASSKLSGGDLVWVPQIKRDGGPAGFGTSGRTY